MMASALREQANELGAHSRARDNNDDSDDVISTICT